MDKLGKLLYWNLHSNLKEGIVIRITDVLFKNITPSYLIV